MDTMASEQSVLLGVRPEFPSELLCIIISKPQFLNLSNDRLGQDRLHSCLKLQQSDSNRWQPAQPSNNMHL